MSMLVSYVRKVPPISNISAGFSVFLCGSGYNFSRLAGDLG